MITIAHPEQSSGELKRSAKDLSNDSYAMFFVVFFFCFFYSDFLFKAYVVGTNLNCMGTHKICLYKEVDKNYTGSNLKTTELLDCALIGAHAVIRSNTVFFLWRNRKNSYMISPLVWSYVY